MTDCLLFTIILGIMSIASTGFDVVKIVVSAIEEYLFIRLILNHYYITQKPLLIIFVSDSVKPSSTTNTSSDQRTISDNRARKIFGTRDGHVPDTNEN